VVDRPEGRRALRAAAFTLSALALVVAAVLLWRDRGEAADPAPDMRVSGLRAFLVDEEQRTPEGRYAWTTRWKLCWRPVPAATAYLITVVTSEGIDPQPREVDDPCYEVTVATGSSARKGARPGRDAQLSQMRSTLSVSVAAKLEGGATGPPSSDVEVATPYP